MQWGKKDLWARVVKFSILVIFFLWGTAAGQQSSPGGPAKGPSLNPEGTELQYGPLNPNRRGYTIEKLRVWSNSSRPVSVNVTLTALRHEESNFALDVEKWCRLTPNQGSASQNYPFEFDLKIQFPPKMPAGIPDGKFVGKLKIESPEAVQALEAPIIFSVRLPNLTPLPPEIAEKGITILMRCCIPGEAGGSLRIKTDATNGLAVRVIAPPILINEQTQASLPQDEVWISLGKGDSRDADMTIPDGDRGIRIPLQAHVKNRSLEAGNYRGQLAVHSEMGRTLFVPVTVVVPKSFWVSRLWWFSLIFTVLTGVLLAGRPLLRFRTYRNRFQGSDILINKVGNTTHIPNPWNDLLAPVYRADSSGVENWHITSRRCQTTIQPPDPLSPPGSLILRQDKRIQLVCGADHYQLTVIRATPFELLLRLTDSPFRRSRLLTQLAFALPLLGLGILGLWKPEFWCRFLQ